MTAIKILHSFPIKSGLLFRGKLVLLSGVIGLWGEDCIGCQADLDDSGMIDGADLTKVLGAWGAGS